MWGRLLACGQCALPGAFACGIRRLTAVGYAARTPTVYAGLPGVAPCRMCIHAPLNPWLHLTSVDMKK